MAEAFFYAAAAAGGAAALYLAWRADPAWIFSIALVLSVFASNWDLMGIPGALAPDRLLLVIGVIGVVVRAPGSSDRPPLRLEPMHLLLAAAALYAVFSAMLAGTLFEKSAAFDLLEHFGLIPFAVFFVAQTAFRTPRQRRVLLGAMVALGAYLGVTALLETVGATGALFPRYIADPSVGIHFGRARGPFLEAVSNGVALFACGTAAAVALISWRNAFARAAASAVLVLCAFGALFTLQRSIWIASIAATVVALLAVRELRRWSVPVVAVSAIALAIAIVAIPGLSEKVSAREGEHQSIWDRQNLARAATNMIDARPLVGFGWARFTDDSIDYFELSDDYPLTAAGVEVHNVYLRYGAELGLIGLTLWALAALAAVGGGLMTRGPPELRRWKIALGTYAVFYGLVAAFVPAQVFPVLMLWLLAGVVWAGRLDLERAPAVAAFRRAGPSTA